MKKLVIGYEIYRKIAPDFMDLYTRFSANRTNHDQKDFFRDDTIGVRAICLAICCRYVYSIDKKRDCTTWKRRRVLHLVLRVYK